MPGAVSVQMSEHWIRGHSLEMMNLKAAALDPYVAVKDAYHQNRQSSIKD